MPELPEVETIKNGLAPYMEGRVIERVDLRRAGLRIPFPIGLASRVTGQRIASLSRRAKYILMTLEDGDSIALHLGMSGRVTVLPKDSLQYAPIKHDHMLIHLSDGGGMVLNDARRFGMVFLVGADELTTHPAFAQTGPEPLSNAFSGPVLLERLRGKSTPVKIALLDQRVVAGVGNIYASEALHLSGISPARAGGSLKAAEGERLAAAIRTVLEKAIAAGGSSLKDFRHSDGSMGYFQHGFSVYDRAGQACPACAANGKKKAVIEKTVQGGRATYFCPRCQK